MLETSGFGPRRAGHPDEVWLFERHGGRISGAPETRSSQPWPPRATSPRSRPSSSATTGGCCRSAAICSARRRRPRTPFSTPSPRRTGSWRRGEPPDHLQAWLYRTARNRCTDILRARRELPAGRPGGSTAGLPEEVERRSDLHELVSTSAASPRTSAPRSSCPRSRTSHTPRSPTFWDAGRTRSGRSSTRPAPRSPAGARRASCPVARCARRSRSRTEAGFGAATCAGT